jgi:hypothetical protein
MLDREVVELLRDDPDLLAIADAIVATQPTSERRRQPRAWRMLAAAAVIAVAAAVAVVAPWHGHGDELVGRALAAVGQGPVLHAVIESDVPNETIVNLSSGGERPARQQLTYWYDADRHLLRVVSTVNGGAVFDALVRPNATGGATQPQLDPALTAFVSRYRDALKSGEAREVGRGTVHGRSVIWLGFDYRLFGERVGIDVQTYRPVVIEPLNANGTPTAQSWVIASIDTGPHRASQFKTAHPALHTSTRTGRLRMVAPTKAARLLDWRPLWLGKSFRGLPLQYGQLQQLIHEQPPRPTTRGFMLAYGRGTDRIQISEARTREQIYDIGPGGAPAAGTAFLTRTRATGGPITRQCQAQLRSAGIWLTITGWNQASSLCIDAARALVTIR